jgi:hypothetical protein
MYGPGWCQEEGQLSPRGPVSVALERLLLELYAHGMISNKDWVMVFLRLFEVAGKKKKPELMGIDGSVGGLLRIAIVS